MRAGSVARRPRRRSPPRWVLLLLAALFPAGCDDGPVPGPGTLTAAVVSPHGAEGAAILALHGPGIEGVHGTGSWVRTRPAGGDTVVVVVVAGEPGPLAVRVALADTLRPPDVRIVQVAGPDDVLRPDLDGYRVELAP